VIELSAVLPSAAGQGYQRGSGPSQPVKTTPDAASGMGWKIMAPTRPRAVCSGAGRRDDVDGRTAAR
jgi:hypothetical protein